MDSQATASAAEAMTGDPLSVPLEVLWTQIAHKPPWAGEGSETLNGATTVLEPPGRDISRLNLVELVRQEVVAAVLDRNVLRRYARFAWQPSCMEIGRLELRSSMLITSL